MSERAGHAVLIIDDEAALARNLATFLSRQGWDTRVAETAEEGLALYPEFRPDLVLLDHNLPGMDGLQALGRFRAMDPDCRVVLMTGFGSVDLAVNALKSGALDYLSKPLALGEVRLLIERLLSQDRLQRTVHYYAGREAAGSGLDKIVGDSPAMHQLRQRIRQMLASESQLEDADGPAVLIHGETGTGKELVARALHFDGPRRDGPFVELNCGALPAHLVEAELFGYEKGAFTDARQRKAGLVETAEGGTLFLDEIGEADAATQVKLLKLLEDKRFRRLGGLRDQAVNVRIVSATHQSLEKMVAEGRFRADLYYRLRIVELQVPPLRERGEDVIVLARHFLAHHAQRYRRGEMRLSEGAEQRLRAHRFPGNVRELRNLMEQAVLLATTDRVTELELAGLRTVAPASADAPLDAGSDLNLERAERRLIEEALRRSEGNVTQASRLLGVSRDTLRYRLERLGLRATG
ncbi:sigma-54-dependent transcriptional regulator [Ideonella alba]|uniref:Sigma-54-dependent Fis family transcriptional regulator n=1 Tax=Ideonella alba TaxID=2824118 RepID=A0A940Y9Y9_9BURK|nr:sigma-54 dependent transcriptional regulator [Ideonella alba]MBQ0931341.1 sigma-54-dependent Fis family transcriptional regulator [Ideonella alba]